MATLTVTTPRAATEASCFDHPTPISALFARLLFSFAEMMARERDLEEIDSFDPAFGAWLTAAERARDSVIDLKRALFGAPIARPEDKPLKLAGFLLHAAMLADGEAEIARLRDTIRRKANYFCLPDDSDGHRRINGMVRNAIDLFEEFVGTAGALPAVDAAPDLVLTA